MAHIFLKFRFDYMVCLFLVWAFPKGPELHTFYNNFDIKIGKLKPWKMSNNETMRQFTIKIDTLDQKAGHTWPGTRDTLDQRKVACLHRKKAHLTIKYGNILSGIVAHLTMKKVTYLTRKTGHTSRDKSANFTSTLHQEKETHLIITNRHTWTEKSAQLIRKKGTPESKNGHT